MITRKPAKTKKKKTKNHRKFRPPRDAGASGPTVLTKAAWTADVWNSEVRKTRLHGLVIVTVLVRYVGSNSV